MASGTLQRIRAQSTGSHSDDTDTNITRLDKKDYLGLIDIEAFAKLQISISGPTSKSSVLGSPSSNATLLLGEGGSFVVRRVSNSAFAHPLSTWDEDFDKSKGFVVVKQPSVKDGDDDFDNRLYDAMMELKVSYHKPLRKHLNIVHLHSFMWDIQSNNADALAPSLILEYADLGTVSDFQDSDRLILHSDAKLQVCLDVAEGLSFLNKCGIVHGDVKCENIFLFREGVHEKRQATAMRAKIGDFGSALIGVFEDPNCSKQMLRGYSPPWDAPEKAEKMDALSLRRMDMYSYGLTIWRIMCNGEMPYKLLFWDSAHENVSVKLGASPTRSLTKTDFLALKKRGNKILHLAIDTLKDRPKSDVDSKKIQTVLEMTICIDPISRASSFDEIVETLCPGGSKKSIVLPEPEPLRKGDFGVTDSRFPHFIYLLRTTPASFRSLICEQLRTKAQNSETTSQRALYHLALGVCHWQNFYSCAGKLESSFISDLDSLKAGAEEIWEAAELGNPIAQSLAPKALTLLKPQVRINQTIIEEWLVNSMRHGSIRARNELKTYSLTKFANAVASIKETRRKASALFSSDEISPYTAEFLEDIPRLDPAAKAMLCHPGVSRLHQAAYLGAILVCKELIEKSQCNVDLLSHSSETPLHYAVRGGQLAVAKYLLDKGANINAQRERGARALHLAFCSYDTESILTLLLERGADPEIISFDTLDRLPDRSDYFIGGTGTPLHFSIRYENLDAALILLKNGANPNHEVDYLGSPLREGLQMHSISLLKFLTPWAVQNTKNLPVINELYSSLVGFYAQPMYRILYWRDEKSLGFVLIAKEFIQKYGLCVDERILLSWAIDADETELADHYLNKFFTEGENLHGAFRDHRASITGESLASQDLLLSPDLKNILSITLSVSSKEMIKMVLKYIRKPLASCDDIGTPLLRHVGFRQAEPRENLKDIVSWLVEAGVSLSVVDNLGKGPVQNAAVWNNSNLADVLLDYEPSFEDVQQAMEVCVGKGNSLTADTIMRTIFRKFPQILTIPLPKKDFDFLQLLNQRFDPNYLRAICSRSEFSQKKNLHAGFLQEAIQYAKEYPGGDLAIKERLDEYDSVLMTPLHYAAKNGNVEAAQILLDECANINAYSVYQAIGTGTDLSSFTCTTDLSSLDDEQKNWIFVSSGPTPLDVAYDRDWDMSIFQWLQSDRKLLTEIRFAGGANKEEAEYEERTQTMIDFLRENGAKTRFEIFGQPDARQQERNSRLQKSRNQYKEKRIRENTDTHRRIYRFWEAACALHSAQVTRYEFPDLLTRSDPSRPRFSTIFSNSICQFDRILNITSKFLDKELDASMRMEISRYRSWAQKNHLEEGKLDEIADIPSPSLSIILSASIFITLREITFTLKYIDEALNESQSYLDKCDRCKTLVNDLKMAIKILTSEEMNLKVLSDLAVAEIEAELHISIKDLDLEGNIKIFVDIHVREGHVVGSRAGRTRRDSPLHM